MQEKLKPEMLPDTVQKLLQEKECRFYLAFASGDCFYLEEMYSPDQKRLLYGLPKEYSKLGAALVDAIWFTHPVKVLLHCGQKLYQSEGTVYKCHIAGPLFSSQLQRVRSRDSKADIASSWEIHTKTWQQVNVSTCKKELQAALPERYGGVLEESHLDLKLR